MASFKRYAFLVWLWYSHLAGLGLIAFGIAFALVWSLAVEGGPVIAAIGEPRNITKVVPYRGTLSYDIDAERYISCLGSFNTMMVSINQAGPPAVVNWQRPLSGVIVRRTNDVHYAVELSDAVFPGRWRYTVSIDSHCPTYEHVDQFVSFEIEVKAP